MTILEHVPIRNRKNLLRCKRNSVLIHRSQAVGVAISLDRQERGQGALSAVQELQQSLEIQVVSIIRLNDLIDTLEESAEYEQYLEPVIAYRKKYGVFA